ncbi:MAG: endonuclease Q family protein [Methanomicrobium sp.]|nr:endonuclease Q family protein [Methanomicrobium sp.]MDD4299208.1 endonuclease Q family protein [Methanomicrobium sp.]
MYLYADFHIHSPFSMAASKTTTPKSLIDSCRIKGLDVLGSGDALHPEWRRMWEKEDFCSDDISVIPSAEVEGKGKVHHLILMDNFSAAEDIFEGLKPYSPNINKAGRPNVALSGEDILEIVHDCGGYAGPAHAFTPWTGMYGRFESIHDCYGEQKPDFLELGLSADTSYGDKIKELCEIPFLSNSDAHSALPNKIGREFNKIKTGSKRPEDILRSVLKGDIILNAGFFPEEGKYNKTACTRCYKQFSLSDAKALNWRCDLDGGRIKEGVCDRAKAMSDESIKSKRPDYLHIMPLGEILKEVLCLSSASAKKCCSLYSELISAFGNEIAILIDVPPEKISKIDENTATAIQKFREGKIILHPGGGGMYGTFEL